MSKTDIPPKFKAGEIVVLKVEHWRKNADYDGQQATIVGKGNRGWLVHVPSLGTTLEISESNLISVGEEIERIGKKIRRETMEWQPNRDVLRKRYEDPDPAAQTARQKEARRISDIEAKMREILALTEDDPI